MAGAIGISDQLTWFTNGWGWRQLMGRAVHIAPAGYREKLDHYQVQPGLTLTLLDEQDRVPVAEILSRAAEDLAVGYEQSGDDYERRYAERLRNLVTMLSENVTGPRPGD